MLSELGTVEYGLTLVVLGLGAVVLILALVYMIRLLSMPQPVASAPVPALTPAPAPAVEPKAEPKPEPAPEPVKAAEPPVAPKAKSDLAVDSEIPDDLLPVLIAAAATAIGKPVRLKDVVLVRTEKPNVWGTQGRIVIQRSHNTASQQW